MADVEGVNLNYAVALLGAGVAAVPLFTRLGLGSVLGYLAAGLLVGPFALAVVTDAQTVLHVAEIGVVLFLFIIGLEMRPRRLWTLRRAIFGLGAAQVLTCGALLTLLAVAAGFTPAVAFIGAMGFVLSSTAVIMRMLEERGTLAAESGQRSIAILLFEDLSIVPLLAIVALLASLAFGDAADARPAWLAITIAAGALAVVIAAGRWLLDPLFSILARTGAREVMTAAALLVVLGTALFMQWAGLSMAMGAFLAGVLLSESTFRHQLEADIEPFRGILLGLFFMSVGMSLDLSLVAAQWRFLLAGVILAMIVKAIGIYVVARIFGADRSESIHRTALFAQGGEFAFVLYSAALGAGVFDAETSAVMTAIVILSMALTPLVVIFVDRLPDSASIDTTGVEKAEGLRGRVLVIGFGRFAQIVTQPLLARNVDLSVIENDVEMIQAAGNFGFKVYYGDGTRLDVLHASGAHKTEAILVCVDKPDAADKIVELCKAEFPYAKLYVRAFDRGHSLRLIEAGVEYQIRETFESAVVFSREVMIGLGVDPDTADEEIAEVRRRDDERLELQLAGGITAGRWLFRNNTRTPQPEPFIKPQRPGEIINPEEPAAAPGS
ncbi:monovalent cation:proton antiporter-2 (CPA2) family protein [Allosphingosinicella indica]|uniref:Kef-type potassium/proton antiporter, CPA2 family n=1 Tax=Allosphingosinicella indica TaxID=941907 RepID=A0A1X7GYT2_9SPHN|nr:monovalent cation:proton antiporter-2 (CPA2) family protein [Allosphingosinicella indica]SMF76862.1 Kef-type potassium/proton antiporter, CPA2 family [Allosphingosinicella indica]